MDGLGRDGIGPRDSPFHAMAGPAWLVYRRSLDKLGRTEAGNHNMKGHASEMDTPDAER
jgi:hypothetical protein